MSKRSVNLRLFWLLIVGGGICGSLLVGGCAPATKRKWLTTFFDGVPAANSGTNAAAPPSQAGPVQAPPTPRPGVAPVKPPEWVEPVLFRHAPYQEEKCNECHESKFSQRLKGTVKEVCFSCHKDFLANAKVKHAAADSGDCLTCHHPHQSTSKFLLVRTGKAMCFECHDDFLEKAKMKHAPVESGECLSCHAPHHSTNKFLLVRTGKALCFECHDDFLEKAKFQHTAVGDCSSCHSAHKADETALLIKSREQLCLECHEQKALAQSKGHAQMGNTPCLKCHDPHVGKDKFLLKTMAKNSEGTKAAPQ